MIQYLKHGCNIWEECFIESLLEKSIEIEDEEKAIIWNLIAAHINNNGSVSEELIKQLFIKCLSERTTFEKNSIDQYFY